MWWIVVEIRRVEHDGTSRFGTQHMYILCNRFKNKYYLIFDDKSSCYFILGVIWHVQRNLKTVMHVIYNWLLNEHICIIILEILCLPGKIYLQ